MKKRIIAKILIILIIVFNISIFVPYHVVKAYNKMNFRNITIEEGLSQATVEGIYQDSRGYIWIGTHDGLNRYNGYDFKVYKYNEENNQSIASNTIIDIEEDSKGNLWVGTVNGLSKINIYDDSVKNYYNDSENGSLSHYNICDILITEDDNILVATAEGLNVYNEKKDSFYRVLDKKDENSLTSQVIYSLDQDELGNIWVGTELGLNKIDKEKRTVEKVEISEINKNALSIYRVYADNEGFVWIGTLNSGLLKVDIMDNSIKSYKTDNSSIPGNKVKNILKDKNSDIWVCTDNGLAKLNENEFLVYKNKIYDSMSIADNNTISIIQDKSGLIWVGTFAGISIFDPDNRIEHYKHDPFINNSLSDNNIQGVYEDKDGLLWIGTNTKGINIIDRKSDSINHINKENYKDICNEINFITGIDNYVWVATDEGLYKIDKEKSSLERFTIEHGLNSNNITTLLIDKDTNLWIGTDDGINILNTEDDSIIDITDKLKNVGIVDTYISTMYQDSDGIYWLGSFIDSGLIKIDKANNVVKIYKKDKGNSKTISSNAISSIVEDKEHNLWIATKYGLNKFNRKSEEFTRYTEKDGLANDNVYGILIDDENNPWMSSNYGISKLEVKNDKFINLNITDGLQSNEFNGNSYYKSSKGEFLFGGINGLNIFNPKELTTSDYAPKILFDEFEVNGNIYTNVDGLEFESNENMIRFKVFLADYKNTNKIQYYYKLDSINDEWHEINENEFTYNNLSSGKHTLKIRARNHDGVISKEKEVTFKIKAPLWQSKEAILIYIILIAILIYNNQNKMKRLDRMVEHKTKRLRDEMEKNTKLLNKVIDLERTKNNIYVNLSHELRTPLNVICSSEQLISELNREEENIDKNKLANYMDGIKRNSERLLHLINNIIDASKIESGRYKINLKDNDIVYIVEETALSLKKYIESKGIELIVDPEVEEKIIECDRYEIERCVVNLVSNAIKFTPEGGKIEVNLKDLKDKIKIEVIDSGTGIDPKYHKLIFDRFGQAVESDRSAKDGSGLGLTITKQIIEMHRGEIYLDSNIGEGSKFTIILPVRHKSNDRSYI